MESVAGIKPHNPRFLNLSANPNPTPFRKPISTISFSKPPTKSSPIKSSAQSHQNHNKKQPQFQTLNPLSSFLKTTCIAITSAALFFNRFQKPSIAAPVSTPTVDKENDQEKERVLEEYLDSNPDDVKALKAVMEVKINAGKVEEAISIIDRLVQAEPTEKEWPLMKSHLLSYSGDTELAKLGFEEVISGNPLDVEAYHGLVMAASESEPGELENVLERIEEAMEICEKEKRKQDLRDFKLLVAQVRVLEGKYTDALKIYQELVKEERRDFRPYLCQGIVYSMLKKPEEAEKQFSVYRRLVPKGHPYARYFQDTMASTKKL